MARTIGKLAKEAGVNVETVRYYERRGILNQPEEPSAGWRTYDDEAVRVIRFIKRGQDLGFTLNELEDLIGLRHSRRNSCRRVQQVAETKISQIESKIADLQAMRRALKKLVSACESEGGELRCPILETLSGKLTP